MAVNASSEDIPLRLEIVVSTINVSSVGEQISHLVGLAAGAGKACELSLRLTLMEYPVLSIVPPAVDIEASPVVDFGGRGKSCDFTVKAEAAGIEPVPLWLLLVLRVGPDEPYLLATACFDMRRNVEKAASQRADQATVPFDRITLALAPTTGPIDASQPERWNFSDTPGSVEVSVFLRMSRVASKAPLRRDKASEAMEPPRQPTVVCATANVGTEPWPEEEEEEEGERRYQPPGDHFQRTSDGLMIDTGHGGNSDRGRSMSRSRGGTAHSTGLSPGRLRQRLSHSVEEQLRRSRERRRTLSRSLSRRRSRSPPMSALDQLNRRGRERFGSILRRSTSDHALRLSAPFQSDVSPPRLPCTAPSLHDVLATGAQDARRRRASLGPAVTSPSSRKPSRAPIQRRVPLAKTLSLIQELSSEITKIQQRMAATKTSHGAEFGGETVTCFCCGAEVPIDRADVHAKRRCLRVLPSALSSVHNVAAAAASRRGSRQVWR